MHRQRFLVRTGLLVATLSLGLPGIRSPPKA